MFTMIKTCLCVLFITCLSGCYSQAVHQVKKGKTMVLFNGSNLDHWEGDKKLWHIERGELVAGDTTIEQPENDFLCTKKEYKNYILRLKFKLEGSRGWVNSGVQLHSQRSQSPPLFEMIGYQAEMANPCWGCIYDESRRKEYLITADHNIMDSVIHKGNWNDYEIRCIGRRIVILLNGVQAVDYTEPQNEYPSFGKIAVQIHSKGYTKISFREILLQQF